MDILSNSVTRTVVVLGVAAALGCATGGAPTGHAPGSAAAGRKHAISRPPEGSTPVDLDGDGKPDAWTLPGAGGAPDVIAYDLDGDGAPDVLLSFLGGRLVRSELLHDMGSIPATSTGFADGRLASKVHAHDGAGGAIAPEQWRDGAPEPGAGASGGASAAPGDRGQ